MLPCAQFGLMERLDKVMFSWLIKISKQLVIKDKMLDSIPKYYPKKRHQNAIKKI